MKTMKTLAAALLLAATMPVQAQRMAVQAAFIRLATSPKAQVTHTVSYDGAAGNIKPVLEVYNFRIKSKHSKLIDEIVQAMLATHTDPDCYRIEAFGADGRTEPRPWDLLYGESGTDKVEIGRNRRMSYTFINLADNSPAAAGQYRTCYCIEWLTIPGLKNYPIDGRLIKTYARIPQAAPAAPVIQYEGRADYLVPDTAIINLDGREARIPFEALSAGDSGPGMALAAQAEPLTVFSMLRQSFLESGHHATVIAPVIYTAVKHIVRSGKANADERALMVNQLKEMIRRCTLDSDGRAAADYLRLAIKVLETNQAP